jgi:hypothetical protein
MDSENRIISLPLGAKDFKNIYISPGSLKKAPTPVAANPEIEKLRAKVFNPELDELIQKVSQKKKDLEILKSKPLELFTEKDTQSLQNLNLVFTSRNKKLTLTKYLSHELGKLSIHSFMLSRFSEFDGLYYPELFYGLAPATGELLYFHNRGSYLQRLEKDSLVLPFDESLAANTFFRKKMDDSDFENYSGLFIQRFVFGELNGILILFYKDSECNASNLQAQITEHIQKILYPIFPVLNLFFMEQEKATQGPDYDFLVYEKIIKHAKAHVTRGESDTLNIFKIAIGNFDSLLEKNTLRQEAIHALRDILEETESLIEAARDEFYFISPNMVMEKITNSLGKPSLKKFNFLISNSKYPEDDKNLYLHF